MPFIDTHVHLHFPEYGEDREAVIRRSREAGVELFINVGTDRQSSLDSLKLAHQHEFVYSTAGIHPHDAKEASDQDFQAIEQLLHESKVVAIGGGGVGFYPD